MVWWWHPQSKPMRASRSTSKVSDELWTSSVLQWCVFKLTQEIKRSRVLCRYLMMLRSFSGGISLVLLYPFSILLFIWISTNTDWLITEQVSTEIRHILVWCLMTLVQKWMHSFCALKSKVVPGALVSPAVSVLNRNKQLHPLNHSSSKRVSHYIYCLIDFDWFPATALTCRFHSLAVSYTEAGCPRFDSSTSLIANPPLISRFG